MRTAVNDLNVRIRIHVRTRTEQRVEKRRARLANAAARLKRVFFSAADAVCSLPAKFKGARPHHRVEAPLFARLDHIAVDDIRRLADVEQAVLLHFIVSGCRERRCVFRYILRMRLYFVNGHRRQHRIDHRLDRRLKRTGPQGIFDQIRRCLIVEGGSFLTGDIVEALFAFPVGNGFCVRLRGVLVKSRGKLRQCAEDRFPVPGVCCIELTCACCKHILHAGIVAAAIGKAIREHLRQVIAHAKVACTERPACVLHRHRDGHLLKLLFRRVFHKAGRFFRGHAAHVHADQLHAVAERLFRVHDGFDIRRDIVRALPVQQPDEADHANKAYRGCQKHFQQVFTPLVLLPFAASRAAALFCGRGRSACIFRSACVLGGACFFSGTCVLGNAACALRCACAPFLRLCGAVRAAPLPGRRSIARVGSSSGFFAALRFLCGIARRRFFLRGNCRSSIRLRAFFHIVWELRARIIGVIFHGFPCRALRRMVNSAYCSKAPGACSERSFCTIFHFILLRNGRGTQALPKMFNFCQRCRNFDQLPSSTMRYPTPTSVRI